MRRGLAVRSGAIALALAGFAFPVVSEETFVFDRNHSTVGFQIRHTVGRVSGRFRDYDGTIRIDRQNPAVSRVELTIRAASIDTDNDKRDADLRSPSFFDVEKYPTITFKSSKIDPKGSDTYLVTGDFTMHGVTRSIQIPVKSNGFAKMGKTEKAGFSIAFPLSRKEYGLTWNRTLDEGGLMLGDEVEISIEIEANKTEPEAPKTNGGR
ncbi:MAG: YceI family protein [Thermoanaerobaculia bacterium]